MTEPLVSILIPCRNAEPWIGAALESALAQTWPRVEIIVVDDGSTDNSLALARRFESGRCRILKQEHAGASAARNRAFGESQGEYIQYLDADDLLAPGKIAEHLRVASSAERSTLSFGSVVHFFDSPQAEIYRPGSLLELPGQGVLPCDFLADLWSGEGTLNMVQTGQWLTPRSLIENSGPWNESISVDDDGEFFARVILTSKRVVSVPKAVCHYRKFRNGRNLSARADRKSSMLAAQLKSASLLGSSSSIRVQESVRRVLTREIVEAYPRFPAVVEDGLQFLRRNGLQMSDRLEGSPWFLRLYPHLGWKMTRRLQSLHRAYRAAT